MELCVKTLQPLLLCILDFFSFLGPLLISQLCLCKVWSFGDFFGERKEHQLGKQQNSILKVERLQQSEFPSAVCVDLNFYFFLFGLYNFIMFSLPLSLRCIF